MINVSVILCTHNPREDFLRRVMEGLKKQTLPREAWELLLVDNASTAPLAECYDLGWHPHGRHVREAELGLTPARLRGIVESTANLLVFVDDDAVLDADYLEQAVSIGQEFPFLGAWGGRISLECEAPIPEWARPQLWRLTEMHVPEDVWSNVRDQFATIPVGAGLCIRRTVGERFREWIRLSGENKILDRTGNEVTGYGDIDLVHCAFDLGLGAGKFKRLHLMHLIPSNRLTIGYFTRHAEGDAASYLRFRALRGLPVQKPDELTWKGLLKWKLHCLFSGVPREHRLIWSATRRGLQKGWSWVTRYRNSKAPSEGGTA